MTATKSSAKQLRRLLLTKGCIASTGGKGRLIGKIGQELKIDTGDVEQIVTKAGAVIVQRGDYWKVILPRS